MGEGTRKNGGWHPTEEQIRIARLKGRRPQTKWSASEIKAWKEFTPVSEEDFRMLEKYYSAKIPLKDDIRRRDLGTLLNNWNGEVDRARNFKPANCLH